jgi:hypothetical protein
MKHFGQAGVHASALTGREDDDATVHTLQNKLWRSERKPLSRKVRYSLPDTDRD